MKSLSEILANHLFRLSFWGKSSDRRNLGFLFAIDNGAEEVIDLGQGGSMPSTHNMEGYVPVTYPTGLLWNPYPTMLGKFDMWPQSFPPELKSVKQEVLNKEQDISRPLMRRYHPLHRYQEEEERRRQEQDESRKGDREQERHEEHARDGNECR